MAKAVFNPNTYDCDVTLSGVGDGDNPVGKEYYIEVESTNYYIAVETTPPVYQIQYGSGWRPHHYEIRGTFNTEGYGRIAAYLDWSNTMTDFEYDGSALWGITDLSIKGIRNGSISDITFSGWTATRTLTWHNSDASVDTTTEETTEMRFAHNPLIGIALNNIAPRCIGTLTTNIPVFLTQAQADAYLRTGDTDGQVNVDTPVDPQTYDYYMYNQITTTLGAGYDWQYLYRYKMEDGKRLAMYMYSVASYPQFDRMLIGTDGIDVIYKGDNVSDENFPQVSGTDTHFLGSQRKMSSGTTYTPLMYQTNIPTFDTYAHALNYINTGDETGIIDKWRTDDIVPGEIGEPTDQTEQGENGMVYSFGGGMYRLSSSEMAIIYSEIFDPSPSIQSAILDGLKLFGSNQINAIVDVMYLPIDVDDVATLSSGSNIFLGSYQLTQTGDRVLKNDKLINMGSVYFAPPYGSGDFRNYEPSCKIYVMLPYAGTHELQISKYIGKNIGLKLAVDVSTGSATYYLYSNGTIMDSFDFTIGAHRPITATDHARYVSESVNAIMQTGVQSINTVSSAATGGATTGNLTSTAGGAIGAVMSGYQTMQVLNDAPMTQRGGHSGAISLFDVTSPYFVFSQMQPVQPSNLLRIKGKPSSAGGKLSSFTGYFESVTVDLPSFSGTEQELEEIMSILNGGIYID